MVGIITLVIVILIIMLIVEYNKLVHAKQNVVEDWADIDVQLKRRQNLIPNLVSVVGEYSDFEKNVLEKISQTRALALTVEQNDLNKKSQVEKEMGQQLKSILALAESNPDLKANSEYLNLQKQLVNTEDEIASARRIYNTSVADYNSLLGSFPVNSVAFLFHFTACEYFQNDAD